tara:strand:+ start:1669 stop:1818 length:150 start_codon:yes stop_codon:yes gene_type:complete
MALFDNLLTVGILLVLGIIIYLKLTQKTLPEFARELRETFATDTEEVIQ